LANTISTRSILTWLVGLSLLLFLIGLLTILMARLSAARVLRDTQQRLQSKGIPTDAMAWNSLHLDSSSNENAVLWMRVLDSFESDGFKQDCEGLPVLSSDETLPLENQPWLHETAVQNLLSQHSKPINNLIELGQGNGPIAFPIEFPSTNTTLPYTQKMRSAARVLILESYMAARNDDGRREFRAINAMLGCAIVQRGEPAIVSQLISAACHAMAITRLKSAIEGDRLNGQQLSTLQKRLQQFSDIGQPYSIGLKGEAAMVFTSESIELSGAPRISTVLQQLSLRDRAVRKFAEQLELALEIKTNNLQEFAKQARSLEDSSQQNSEIFGNDWVTASLGGLKTPLCTFANHLTALKMRNDLAQLAISIRQFQRENGAIPDSLQQLESIGIDLAKFSCVDGQLPKYMLVPNQTDAPADGAVAILWSFNPLPLALPNAPSVLTVPATPPPPLTDSEDRFGNALWRWDLRQAAKP
jgi:hypothetical protein